MKGALSLITAAIAACVLAGCATSGGASPGERASASAAASRLAHDPAVIRAKAKWEPVVKDCAGQQHWILHPVKATEGTITCAASGLSDAQKKQAEKCAVTGVIGNGIGHGKLLEDEDTIARCLAKAAPKGPGK